LKTKAKSGCNSGENCLQYHTPQTVSEKYHRIFSGWAEAVIHPAVVGAQDYHHSPFLPVVTCGNSGFSLGVRSNLSSVRIAFESKGEEE